MVATTRPYDRRVIKKLFKDEGISVTQWALERGFRRDCVYAVLDGRIKGTRGQGHEIALALGLKVKPEGGPCCQTIKGCRAK